MRDELRVRNKKLSIKLLVYYPLSVLLLLTIQYLLFPSTCSSQEGTTITSDTLEYEGSTSTYNAKGSVEMKSEGKVIDADELSYNAQTSYVTASGDVRYDDAQMVVTAREMELNLENNTGRLYDGSIFFKEENYHISGKSIEKKSETNYFAPEATFSTCDGPVPAWSFKGKDVDLLYEDRLKAKDVSFYIKGIPALYAPYFFLPFLAERQTGFLIPVFGVSKSRGVHFRVPFFWAISESRDATLVLDYYSKRGIGEGLEYRYVEPGGIKGNWWLYHINDTELNKDYFEIRSLHEERSSEGIGGFLSLNYVNEKDFYREFSPYIEVSTIRFLESTGEIAVPFENSRAYLLAQYWVDLEEDTTPPPQRLPEVGYVLYPAKVGPLWFSGTATVSNFWRDEDVIGQRLDIFPRILSTLGNEIVLTQAIGFRETAYVLHRTEEDSLHREAFEYDAGVHTSFLKRYSSFTHIIEPSIGYTFITDSEKNPPLFDSTEFFKKTSTIEASILNRFFYKGAEVVIIRATQAYDAELGDRPFLPFRLDVGIKRPVSLRLDAAYDVHEGKLESINSELSFNIPKGTLWIGQQYNRLEDVTFYRMGFNMNPYKSWNIKGATWYDANLKEIRDFNIGIQYSRQCWGLDMEYIKRPHDYTFSIMFDLKGITNRLKI